MKFGIDYLSIICFSLDMVLKVKSEWTASNLITKEKHKSDSSLPMHKKVKKGAHGYVNQDIDMNNFSP